MITLITGPMKSGKSTELFRQMERKHIAGKTILYVGPKKDDREFYARGIPRSKLFEVATVKTVTDWSQVNIQEYVNEYDAIFVDEFFMISNNKLLCETIAINGTKNDIFFAGLLADANAKLWSESIEILPYCDEIFKMNAVCENCGSEHANYSFMKNIKPGQILVGDSEYKALCRRCFLKLRNK